VRNATPDAVLFVVGGAAGRFDAIETAAAVAGLPVFRATRRLDGSILRSAELGFLNGHVPVTGILSAISLLAALMCDRDAVVMSNEWSASSGNVTWHGQMVNHQYSKSLLFERALRAAVAGTLGSSLRYFSLLRPFSELWIAREFSQHDQYLRTFRSCNRAFYVDPNLRLPSMCGRCDKCVFIDLILSPFVPRDALEDIYGGNEPLQDPEFLDCFRTLIGTSGSMKPFECVGDIDECRAAVVMASARADRAESTVLQALEAELRAAKPPSTSAIERLLVPIGDHFVPEPYATRLRLA
jgi:hypothetical protein